MARAAPQKRARAPRRPPPVYQVVVIPPVQADPRAVTALATQASDLAARVEAIRVGLGAAGHEDWRRVVEALFGPRGVLLYPDGTLELRGSVAVGSDLAPVRLSARARRG